MKAPAGFDSLEDFVAAFAGDVGGLISYVDAQGRVQFASRALCAWWQLKPEEVRGKTLLQLYGASAYAQFAQWTDRVACRS